LPPPPTPKKNATANEKEQMVKDEMLDL
jgi:hypothetical protein